MRSRRELETKKMEVQKERDIMKTEHLNWKSKNQVKMRWERELTMLKRTQEQLEQENFNVDAAKRDLEKIRNAERLATIKMFEEAVQMQVRHTIFFLEKSKCPASDRIQLIRK